MKISRFAIALVAIVSLAFGVSAALGATHAATRAVTVKTGNSSLGRIIVDARGRTLYLFEKDTRVTAPARAPAPPTGRRFSRTASRRRVRA